MRILIVDDDEDLARLLKRDLQALGYTVDVVALAEHALLAASDNDYALMVVDLGLPDRDGLDLLRDLRERRIATPILVLTARRQVQDRVVGLSRGADDYLVKPFALPEFRARVLALLRRPAQIDGGRLSAANMVIDRQALEALIDGEGMPLTRKQFTLLELLVRRKGHLTPKRMIEEALYGFDDEVSPNAIEAQVYKLRVALRSAGAGVAIETRRGIGYRLVETEAAHTWSAELDGSFLARLADDRREFAALMTRIGAEDEAALASLVTLAHRLAGAAGTFGFASIGTAAASLEDAAEAAERSSGAERHRATVAAAGEAGRLAALIDAALDGVRTRAPA